MTRPYRPYKYIIIDEKPLENTNNFQSRVIESSIKLNNYEDYLNAERGTTSSLYFPNHYLELGKDIKEQYIEVCKRLELKIFEVIIRPTQYC